MDKKEILQYIQLRASGIGQAPNYTYKDFFNEMVEMQRKEVEKIEIKLEENQKRIQKEEKDVTMKFIEHNNSVIILAPKGSGKTSFCERSSFCFPVIYGEKNILLNIDNIISSIHLQSTKRPFILFESNQKNINFLIFNKIKFNIFGAMENKYLERNDYHTFPLDTFLIEAINKYQIE